MTLLLCARQLVPQEGVYWVVLASELALSALRTYQEGGPRRDRIHHLNAHGLGVERLAPKAAINMAVTPLY